MTFNKQIFFFSATAIQVIKARAVSHLYATNSTRPIVACSRKATARSQSSRSIARDSATQHVAATTLLPRHDRVLRPLLHPGQRV